MLRALLAVLVVGALQAPAVAEQDDEVAKLKLLRQLGPGGLGVRNGELPINLSGLRDTIMFNRHYVHPKAPDALVRLTKLAHEDPAAATEADFDQAGFGWLFADVQIGATMGTRTPAMRAAYLKAALVAWRSLTRGPKNQALPDGDVYPSQLGAILEIPATKAKPAARDRTGKKARTGAPTRTPRR